MKLPDFIASILEITLNRALQLDEHTLKQVIALQGKVIGVELIGLDIIFYLAPSADGVQLLTELDSTADTIIRGTPFSLLKTALSDDRKTLFQGDVVIEGDMVLGQKMQKILENLEMDWEEPLSQIVGDIAAHNIGEVVRGFNQFALSAFNSITTNTAEYFQEETRDVVNPTELNRFADKIDNLRGDVDRLDVRFQKLKEKLEA